MSGYAPMSKFFGKAKCMEKRYNMGKKMLRVLCCGALICVVAGVSFAAENQYQKSILKSKSVDYIKKLNEVYHPAEIYDKKCAKLSTSDNEQILHMTDKLLNNIDKKSLYYKMTKDDIKEIIDNEMKMSPDKRVKSTKVECVRQVASKVGKNKAYVVLVVRETSEKYNGDTGSSMTEYDFSYKKVSGKWKLENVAYDYMI